MDKQALATFIARSGPAPDGIHPFENGHVIMAYAFLKALNVIGDVGTIVLAGGRIQTTFDNLPNTPTTAFELALELRIVHQLDLPVVKAVSVHVAGS